MLAGHTGAFALQLATFSAVRTCVRMPEHASARGLQRSTVTAVALKTHAAQIGARPLTAVAADGAADVWCAGAPAVRPHRSRT